MNPIRHLLVFTARRIRVVLACWMLVVVACVAVEGLRPAFAARPQIAAALAVTASLLWLTQVLLTFVLVSSVIHADPAVGSDAFWMTRPIAPWALAASKLALLFIAGVMLPALARSILIAAYEISPRVNAGVTLRGIEMQSVILALAAFAAVVTSNFARFALLCGGALFAVAASMAAFVAMLMARWDDETFVASVSVTAPDPTGGPVFSVLLVLAAIAAICEQYRRRALLRSVVVLLFGIGLAAVVSWAWPWQLLAQRLEVPSWSTTPALQLAVNRATIATDNGQNVLMRRGGRLSAIGGVMTLSGLQPGWSAHVLLRNASVTVDSRTLQSVAGIVSAQLSLGGPDAQYADVMTRVLGVRPLGDSQPPQVERQTLFAATEEALRPYATSAGRYHGDFSVALTHHTIEATLPLQPGAKHAAPAFRVVVDGVSRLRGDALVTIRESRASSLYDRRPLAFYTYYLRSRERQEAVIGSEADAIGQFSLLQLVPLGGFGYGTSYSEGFFTRGVRLWFPRRPYATALTLGVHGLDDAWLSGAELVIVRMTQEGSVERTLDIAEFPLGHVVKEVNSSP